MSRLDSIEEWVKSWGNGKNWSDPSGATIPATKESLAYLLRVARAAEEAHRLLAISMETRPADWAGVSIARSDLQRALEDKS